MRSALVTGGSKRLGKAICLALADMGFNIALHYASSDPSEAVAEIMSRGVQCETFKADLSNAEQAAGLVQKAKNAFPDLSMLVNCASIFERGTTVDTEVEFLDRHYATNFRAPFILSRDFARHVGEGLIVNMVDTRVVKNDYQTSAYSLSKKSLHELTKITALEFAPKIRVNAIAPGLILAPPGKGEEYLQTLAIKTPLQKRGGPDDIVAALKYLVEQEYVTGETLFVDGGIAL